MVGAPKVDSHEAREEGLGLGGRGAGTQGRALRCAAYARLRNTPTSHDARALHRAMVIGSKCRHHCAAATLQLLLPLLYSQAIAAASWKPPPPPPTAARAHTHSWTRGQTWFVLRMTRIWSNTNSTYVSATIRVLLICSDVLQLNLEMTSGTKAVSESREILSGRIASPEKSLIWTCTANAKIIEYID